MDILFVWSGNGNANKRLTDFDLKIVFVMKVRLKDFLFSQKVVKKSARSTWLVLHFLIYHIFSISARTSAPASLVPTTLVPSVAMSGVRYPFARTALTAVSMASASSESPNV